MSSTSKQITILSISNYGLDLYLITQKFKIHLSIFSFIDNKFKQLWITDCGAKSVY